jgi:deferrochelatase/peroxidase EfeB
MAVSRQKTFGRKMSPQREMPPMRVVRATQTGVVTPAPVPVITSSADVAPLAQYDDVDAELEQWKALRKARRRSFREPWRTAAIVSTVGLGLSSWLLPDSVSTVAELITGGLSVGSLVAGLRRSRYAPPSTATPAPHS